MNYLYTPCYSDSALSKRMEELSDQLRKTYAQRFDTWLGQCVADFCPLAKEHLERKAQIGAIRALHEGGFHYRTWADGKGCTAEFCQGETVLARAKFEVKFTVNKAQT